MDSIHFTVSQSIRKPVAEVFHAVVDPNILSTYFTKASSGPLESGAKVTWFWPGNEEEYFFVENVIPNEKIEGHWKAWKVDYHVTTTFTFISKKTVQRLSVSPRTDSIMTILAVKAPMGSAPAGLTCCFA